VLQATINPIQGWICNRLQKLGDLTEDFREAEKARDETREI
jgi:hypothetical protein